MALSKAKEEILKNVRQALSKRNAALPLPNFNEEIFAKTEEEDLSIVFAENFVNNKGQFVFCLDDEDFIQNLHSFVVRRELKNIYLWEDSLKGIVMKSNIPFNDTTHNFVSAQVGITGCETLIARTGSILLSSSTEAGRRLSIYPAVHIVVAYTSQVVPDIKDGLTAIKKKYSGNLPSMICLETGPSRTADIEKTLVLGAHGPKELILFLIDDTPDQ